jgi:hypothetical protein
METVTGNVVSTVAIVGAFLPSSSKALSYFFQVVCGCTYFGEEIPASSINTLSY